MKNPSADLFLLPSPLAESPIEHSIPAGTFQSVRHIRHFICETPKSARRYLKELGLELSLQELRFHPLNKHTDDQDVPALLSPCLEGEDTALLSDAGSPGIADPGARLVRYAHQRGVRVRPLVGPSSPFLALMGSGLNGQQFRFHGYAPLDPQDLKKRIGRMNEDALQGESQLIMETPYRNDRLLDALLKNGNADLNLCIALELGGEEELVRTLPVPEWEKERPTLHKRPAIFILGK
ncbi:MAG: SAM-dependent methyltransferase [Flavobacteriales bacterium]